MPYQLLITIYFTVRMLKFKEVKNLAYGHVSKLGEVNWIWT